jgi:hypothetical protein
MVLLNSAYEEFPPPDAGKRARATRAKEIPT